MTVESILTAVSKATGVTEEEIKGKSRSEDIAKARGVYFYVCKKNDIQPTVSAEYVNKKHPNAVLQSDKYAYFCERVQEYVDLAIKVSSILKKEVDKKEQEQSIWKEDGNETYIVIKGDRFSVVDVSSRYYGSCFLGMKNGRPLFSRKTKDEAIRDLFEIR